jgi:hypothetical protein
MITRLRIENAAIVPLWYAFTITACLIDVWLVVALVRSVRAVWNLR